MAPRRPHPLTTLRDGACVLRRKALPGGDEQRPFRASPIPARFVPVSVRPVPQRNAPAAQAEKRVNHGAATSLCAL
jgi:hypothetical protein